MNETQSRLRIDLLQDACEPYIGEPEAPSCSSLNAWPGHLHFVMPKHVIPAVRQTQGSKHTKRAKDYNELLGDIRSDAAALMLEAGVGPFQPGTKLRVWVEVYRRQRITQGDVDNYLKSVLDGLQGAAFTDDKDIWEASIKKREGTDDWFAASIVEIEVLT